MKKRPALKQKKLPKKAAPPVKAGSHRLPQPGKTTSFFEDVYEVARQIPKGRVTSYGAIAACLGTRLSARMVGWAMNGAGGIIPKIPAHRVVNRLGLLSGAPHFETPTRMQELLEKEGVQVRDNKVVNFEKHFWDPVTELAL